MLKTAFTGPDGRRVVVLMLSPDNYRLLAPDQDAPIYVDGSELALRFDLLLMTGADERTMMAQLRESFGDDLRFREAQPRPAPTAPEPEHATADHDALPAGAMQAAFDAAHAALVEHGVADPAVVLIAQDPSQRRGLASGVVNVADLLRVVLYNLELQAGLQPPPG